MTVTGAESITDKNVEVLSKLLQEKIKVNKGPRFGKRHIQVIVLACVMYAGFLIRTILSVSIVAMTNSNYNTNKNIPIYNWTDKSMIMSSFIWGYFVTQVGAGYVADRYGAKWLLVASTSVTALLGLLIPTAAAIFGSKGVMIFRVLQGLCQGFLYPSLSSALGKWVPSNERSTLGTVVFTAASMGIVSSLILTGWISSSYYGWPCAFYVLNGVALVIVVIYAYIGCSDPNDHSTITPEEKMYIINNLKTQDKRQELKTPFKEMFTSAPFYALIITNVAYNYTHWTFISETAIFMDKVMNFDLKSNSLLSSLPYIAEIFISFIVGYVADLINRRKLITLTAIRKIMNNIGLIIPAISLYLLGRVNSGDATLVIILLVLVSGFHGTAKAGHIVNHMDLAPNFSGVMMGISNGFSVFCSAGAPMLAHFIVKDETNIYQWRVIFYIALGINVVAVFGNTFFTSGKLQSWSQGTRKKAKNEKQPA